MTERVLDYVKKMPPKRTTNTLAGDPVAGKKK